jgi:hypothetical protein
MPSIKPQECSLENHTLPYRQAAILSSTPTSARISYGPSFVPGPKQPLRDQLKFL